MSLIPTTPFDVDFGGEFMDTGGFDPTIDSLNLSLDVGQWGMGGGFPTGSRWGHGSNWMSPWSSSIAGPATTMMPSTRAALAPRMSWDDTTMPLTTAMMLPAMDVLDTKDNFLVHAELPGMTKDEIQVEINDGDQLIISCETRRTNDYDQFDWRVRERTYGRFQRTVALPRDVDVDKVDAQYQNGILEVKVAKKPGATTGTKAITID